MKLNEIHHVALNVRDLDVALAFYTGVLGFTKVPRPDFGFAGAWLESGSARIHLLEIRDSSPAGGQHFAMLVPDLEAAINHLKSHGVEHRRLPYFAGAGYQVFVKDPSGNEIELNQPDGHVVS